MSYADSQNKKEKLLDVFVDVFSDINFNLEFDFDWEEFFTETSSNAYFCKKVLEMSQNRRSHIKYFVFVCSFFRKFCRHSNAKSMFKDLLLIALDKYNVLNFEKILSLCLKNEAILGSNVLLPKPEEFPEIFETKGLQAFVQQNKGQITQWSSSSRTKPHEEYLTEIFASNREKTKSVIGDLNLIDVDAKLINKYIRRLPPSSFARKRIDVLSNSFLYLNNDDIKAIKQKVYSDVETVKMFNVDTKKNNNVLSMLFFEFIDAYKKGGNKNIDTSKSSTFEVFKYLLENIEIHRSVGFDFNLVRKIIIDNGHSIENFSSLLPFLLSNKYYESLYDLNSINDEKSLENYLEALKLSFDSINLNVYSNLISDSIKHLKKRDVICNTNLSYEDTFAAKIINHSTLKQFFLNKQNVRDLTNDFKFDTYIYFYFLVNNEDVEVEPDDLLFFADNFTGSKKSAITVAKFLSKSSSKDIIENVLDNKKAFQGMIKNSFNYTLIIMSIISGANHLDLCIDKKILSNIIADRYFSTVNNDVRKLVYENFINISDSYGRNKLGSSERIIVRDCLSSGLRKNQKHLKADKELILSYCNNLDNHSKFQMRIVFPGKGMLSQDQDVVEESLVRQYIRLLLT